MQSHGQLLTGPHTGKPEHHHSSSNLIKMDSEAGPELLRRHQHMMSQQNLYAQNPNANNLLMPSIPAATSSDVYEYTLSKAYSSNEDADENEDRKGANRSHQRVAKRDMPL